MDGFDLLIALLIAVGLVGVLVPVLPGLILVLAAVLVWAVHAHSLVGWVVAGACALLFGTGLVAKYLLPGRRMREAGVSTWTLAVAGALGVVGFFVVPVVGLPLGFVVGVYAVEWTRLRAHDAAWAATCSALRAVGLSVLLELGFGTLMAGTWLVGALLD